MERGEGVRCSSPHILSTLKLNPPPDRDIQVIRMDDLVKAGEEELVQLNGHDGRDVV